MITTVTGKNQITIPAAIANRIGLQKRIQKNGVKKMKKWGQCANIDKIYLCPILAACHGACVSNFPALFTT